MYIPHSTGNLNAVLFTCVYESVCESFWEGIPIRSKTVCHAGFNCFSSGGSCIGCDSYISSF